MTLPPAETLSPARAASATTNCGGAPNVAASAAASASRSPSGQPGAWTMCHASCGNALRASAITLAIQDLAALADRATVRKAPRSACCQPAASKSPARRCSRMRRCVISRARAAATRCFEPPPLFVEGIAHSGARFRMRRRDRRCARACALRQGSRRSGAGDPSRRDRASPACATRASSRILEPELRAQPRREIGHLRSSPCRSGTISVSGASAARATNELARGNSRRDIGGDQHERRACACRRERLRLRCRDAGR